MTIRGCGSRKGTNGSILRGREAQSERVWSRMSWKIGRGEQAWHAINEVRKFQDDVCALVKRHQCLTCFGPVRELVAVEVQRGDNRLWVILRQRRQVLQAVVT